MTDEDHDLWEALAVGHAMRALEPADDAQFRAHLATCDRCAVVLAESEELVSALAMAAEPVEPPAALRDRILAISRDSGVRVAPVVSDEVGRRRARRGAGAVARWVASAAVVSAIASSGITYALVHEHHPKVNVSSPGYICLTDPTCRHMPLVADGKTIGAVVMDVGKGKAYIMSPELPRSGDGDQYVVWTGDATGKMTALTAFRVTGGGIFNALDTVPDLNGVAAVAVSREARGALPATPSTPLGIAEVPRPV
ncbi:MAG: putative transrane anti-sigma factor [Frankiales bacterium]|nr:putative transrane anti-sigma factor [Frankiales bacterium]